MANISLQETSAAEAQATAATLVESLPWVKQYRGQVVVIKFGGNAMIDDALQTAFGQDLAYLSYVGVLPVVVHGGGPQISKMLERLAISSEFRGGYRVTSREAISVVRMVLTGDVNPKLVGAINAEGPLAMGMSGEDAGIFGAIRQRIEIDGEEVDLGHVGEVTEVNAKPVRDQLEAGRIPVISSLAPDLEDSGNTLNVNADAAAAALAVALGAKKLVLLTDVPGLYANWPKTDTLISSLTTDDLRAALPDLTSGMVPKMRACLDAVEGGVDSAAVVDGRVPHSALVELFTDKGIGTQVVQGSGL